MDQEFNQELSQSSQTQTQSEESQRHHDPDAGKKGNSKDCGSTK